MKIKFKEAYDSLGTNKSQRFRRFLILVTLVLCVIGGVTVYGFKSDAIRISLGFGTEASK